MERLTALLFILLFITPARAADDGMYLCDSPVLAGGFWDDVVRTHEAGVDVKKDILKSIADKNKCRFLASTSLKPINYVVGYLEITDGKTKGWATPYYYISYINK